MCAPEGSSLRRRPRCPNALEVLAIGTTAICWLRDATLTLLALMNAGHLEEAKAWREWLSRAAAGMASSWMRSITQGGGGWHQQIRLELAAGRAQTFGKNLAQMDEGIWEVRGGARHFTFSKIMAWVAFDRAIKSAEAFNLNGPLDRWRQLCRKIFTMTSVGTVSIRNWIAL